MVSSVFFLIMAAVTFSLPFIDSDTLSRVQSIAILLMGGFWTAGFVLCVTLYVSSRKQHWVLDSQGIEVCTLFRHRRISWEAVNFLRIESYGDWSCYRLILSTPGEKELVLDRAEFLKPGTGYIVPTEGALPDLALDKTEFATDKNLKQFVVQLVIMIPVVIFLGHHFRWCMEWVSAP